MRPQAATQYSNREGEAQTTLYGYLWPDMWLGGV